MFCCYQPCIGQLGRQIKLYFIVKPVNHQIDTFVYGGDPLNIDMFPSLEWRCHSLPLAATRWPTEWDTK